MLYPSEMLIDTYIASTPAEQALNIKNNTIMRIKLKQVNDTSFLSEIGKQKRVVSVNIDEYTLEPCGSSSEMWGSDDIDCMEWSLYYSPFDEYILEFSFKKDDNVRTLEPKRFILWNNSDSGVIIDEGLFDVIIL